MIPRKQNIVDEREGNFFIIDKKRRKRLGGFFFLSFFLKLYDFLIRNNKGWWLKYLYEEKLRWLRSCSLPSKNLRFWECMYKLQPFKHLFIKFYCISFTTNITTNVIGWFKNIINKHSNHFFFFFFFFCDLWYINL